MQILDAAAGASVANALVLFLAVPSFTAYGLIFLTRFLFGSIMPASMPGGPVDD